MQPKCTSLVTWVGHADLLGMASELPANERDRICAAIQKPPTAGRMSGPILTVLRSFRFDEVHLLGDFDKAMLEDFAGWLGQPAKIHTVDLADPTDYAAVFRFTEQVLARVCSDSSMPLDLWLALSSGTPAMAATLVLLGKSRYPARFLQAYQGEAREVDVPFDLIVDFVPSLLQDPDANLQVLADKTPAEVEGFSSIAGTGQLIRLAVGRAKRAAVRDVSVLILGESGVGKELFARAMHSASPRRQGPFVAVNCAALPRELIESQLFGHKRGAFTGATADYSGAFQQADKGTLFLDEFCECDPQMQAKLLRVLQPSQDEPLSIRSFQRLGDAAATKTDVRIIAATNSDPQTAIAHGKLRPDLFYRVASITLRLPSLRERRSDIPKVADALLDRINTEFARAEPGYVSKRLSAPARRLVAQYDWPGNVRQLNNVLVQAAVMTLGDMIGKPDIEAAIADRPPACVSPDAYDRPLGDGFSLPQHLEDIHKHYLYRAMSESGGIKTKAAELLGLKSYQTLDAQLRRLKVVWEAAPTTG